MSGTRIYNKVPEKINPDSGEHKIDLSLLNNYLTFVLNSTDIKPDHKGVILKVINSLKFIKVNSQFIAYAVEHYDQPEVYTYRTNNTWKISKQDKKKHVIRDFNNTSMHFNAYKDPQKVVTAIQELVSAFEKSIVEMENRGLLLEFSHQIKDSDVGCIEARTADALVFAVKNISGTLNFDRLIERCFRTIEKNDDENVVTKKVVDFFKNYIGQNCVFRDRDAKDTDQNKEITWEFIKKYCEELFKHCFKNNTYRRNYESSSLMSIEEKSFTTCASTQPAGPT